MHVSRLHLHQFRSHEDAVFDFDPHVTAIIGPNGSGKTNILEAIYTLCMGKSFRDGDDDLITYEQDWYRIEGSIDDVARELRYQPSNKGKQLIIDGTSKGRFTYRQQLPVVLFEPDDLLMIHGSPSARRKYIDELLQKLSLPYRQLLARYERVLTQRNNLLKQRHSMSELKDNLFVWDVSLAEIGSKIIAMRIDIIEQINMLASETYSDIAGKKQNLTLSYVHPHQQQTESQIVSALTHHLDDDLRRGFTTVGPHRHDIEFELELQSAKHTASRGEVRTILLSLKYIEIQLLTKERADTPILLLDDVFSELDNDRKRRLSEIPGVQVILTTTDLQPDSSVSRITLS